MDKGLFPGDEPQPVAVTRRTRKTTPAPIPDPTSEPEWIDKVRAVMAEVKKQGAEIPMDVLLALTPGQAFEVARRVYPGTKRGFLTEWANFTKKHKDWKTAVYDLYPSIQIVLANNALKKGRGEFVPNWKHFSTWINNRWWETAEAIVDEQKEAEDAKQLGPGRRELMEGLDVR